MKEPAFINTFSGLLTEILMILFTPFLGWIVASEIDDLHRTVATLDLTSDSGILVKKKKGFTANKCFKDS